MHGEGDVDSVSHGLLGRDVGGDGGGAEETQEGQGGTVHGGGGIAMLQCVCFLLSGNQDGARLQFYCIICVGNVRYRNVSIIAQRVIASCKHTSSLYDFSWSRIKELE